MEVRVKQMPPERECATITVFFDIGESLTADVDPNSIEALRDNLVDVLAKEQPNWKAATFVMHIVRLV